MYQAQVDFSSLLDLCTKRETPTLTCPGPEEGTQTEIRKTMYFILILHVFSEKIIIFIHCIIYITI